MNFDKYFTEVFSQGSIYEYFSTGSDDGFVLTMWQTITWTIEGSFTDAYIGVTQPQRVNDFFNP